MRGYEVQALLAQGPAGRVWRARAEGTGAAVVLKERTLATVPDVRALDRFEREREVLARLHHPRLPRCLETFHDGRGPKLSLYAVHTYLPGENLQARLAHHTYDEGEARALALDVLEALAYLHGRSPVVAHGDLTAAHVLRLDDAGHALVGFGGGGTYAPPERADGLPGPSDDLHALGLTLLQLLSRRAPQTFWTPGGLHFRPHLNVTAAFADLLAALVAPYPAARLADVALAQRLLLALPPLEAAPEPTRQVPRLRLLAPAPLPPPKPEPVPSSEWVEPRRRAGGEDGVPWRLCIGARQYGLVMGGVYLLGRSGECELRIDGDLPGADTVSRVHARLVVTAAGLCIEDLGSTNGTWVEDVFLGRDGSRQLRDEAAVAFGRLECSACPVLLALGGGAPLAGRPTRPAPSRFGVEPLGYLGGDPDGVRIVRVVRRRDGSVHLR